MNYVIIVIVILCLFIYFRKNIKESFENVIMTNGSKVEVDIQDKVKVGGDVIVKVVNGKSNTEWISTEINSNNYYPISYFVKGDWKVRMKDENGMWYVYIYDTTYEKLSVDVSISITFVNRSSIKNV